MTTHHRCFASFGQEASDSEVGLPLPIFKGKFDVNGFCLRLITPLASIMDEPGKYKQRHNLSFVIQISMPCFSHHVGHSKIDFTYAS